jgi:hypothetical protein
VIDELRLVLNSSGKTFGQLLFNVQPPRAPRYFQVVFLALHKLLVKDNMEVTSYQELARLLDGSGNNINVPEGGRWGLRDRVNAVNGTAGIYAPAFKRAQEYDPAKVRWITQLENILTQSYTEQAAYDFKQGFLRLDGSNGWDEESFDKILKTLVAIANIEQGTRGYILIGIADKIHTANRVTGIFGVQPRPFERFFVTGVEHEAQALNKSLDQLFQTVKDRILQSHISEDLRDYVARNVKQVRYYDKSVFILESRAQEDPSHLNGQYYIRHGNSLQLVDPKDYAKLFRRLVPGT